jgi:hypothetical protein
LRRPLAFLPFLLALVGCDQAPPGGTPGAGRYEIAVKVTRFEVPGLDAPALNAMQRAIVGKDTKYNYCLSDKSAGKQAKALFRQVGEGSCFLHSFSPKGGKFDVLMTCRAITGRQSYNLKGSVWGTGTKFVATGVMTNPRFPQGQASIVKEVAMKRIADCTPPKPKAKPKGKKKGKDEDDE